MTQPCLVTGATGFIGQRLIERLLASSRHVRALVLPHECVPAAWGDRVEICRGDVTDQPSVAQAVAGAQAVFHLAAVVSDWGDEALYQRVTVGGTRHVLEAAAQANARTVVASSVVVYGDVINRSVCDEDLPWGRALGPYSRSKQQQENLAWQIAREQGLALTVVRPTNVYGPGSKPWVHDLIDQLRSGAPALLGSGNQNAGLCHVDNLVDLLIRAATPAAVGRAYNACDGSDVTWRQYISDLARIAETKPPKAFPAPLATLGAHVCEGLWSLLHLKGRPPITLEALNLVGSHHRVPITRAAQELGYVPTVTYAAGIKGVEAYVRACI